MAVVADLVAYLRLDSGQFTRGAKQASGEADRLAGRFGGMGTALKAAFGAVAVKQILDVGTALFKLGVESQAWERRFNTVFGEAADSVRVWSDQVNEKFGMSDERLRGVASSLGDLLVPMGFTRQAAADMSVEMMNVANALSQWVGGARTAEEAAHIMARGILGERESLKELGVSILESDVQARMLAAGMGGLTGSMREQAKAQITWQLIQEKSADAIAAYEQGLSGGATAAADMRAAIDELKVSAGGLVVQLAPAVSGLANLLTLATAFLTLDFSGVNRWVAGNILDVERSPTTPLGRGEGLNPIPPGQLKANALMLFEQAGGIANPAAALAAANQVAGGPWTIAKLYGGLEPYANRGLGLMQMGGQLIDPTNIGRAGARMGWGFDADVRVAVVNPVTEAFKEARRAAVAGLGAIGNAFRTFELPEISVKDFMDNFSDWQTAQQNVDTMLGELGDHGLAAFAASLANGLSQEELAWIASVWGGNLASLYSLFPSYAPGGSQHPGANNPPIIPEGMPGLPYSGGGGGGAPVVNVHAAGSILTEGGLIGLIEDAVIRIMGRGGRSSAFEHAGASSVHVLT